MFEKIQMLNDEEIFELAVKAWKENVWEVLADAILETVFNRHGEEGEDEFYARVYAAAN